MQRVISPLIRGREGRLSSKPGPNPFRDVQGRPMFGGASFELEVGISHAGGVRWVGIREGASHQVPRAAWGLGGKLARSHGAMTAGVVPGPDRDSGIYSSLRLTGHLAAAPSPFQNALAFILALTTAPKGRQPLPLISMRSCGAIRTAKRNAGRGLMKGARQNLAALSFQGNSILVPIRR